MPFLPYGEYLSFEPLCLPVHSAGSIYLDDPDFGSALNHTRSSVMISYALEAYNRKLFQVCFFVRISCQSHLEAHFTGDACKRLALEKLFRVHIRSVHVQCGKAVVHAGTQTKMPRRTDMNPES